MLKPEVLLAVAQAYIEDAKEQLQTARRNDNGLIAERECLDSLKTLTLARKAVDQSGESQTEAGRSVLSSIAFQEGLAYGTARRGLVRFAASDEKYRKAMDAHRDQSIGRYRESASLEPGAAAAWYNLGLALLGRDAAAAREAFTRAHHADVDGDVGRDAAKELFELAGQAGGRPDLPQPQMLRVALAYIEDAKEQLQSGRRNDNELIAERNCLESLKTLALARKAVEQSGGAQTDAGRSVLSSIAFQEGLTYGTARRLLVRFAASDSSYRKTMDAHRDQSIERYRESVGLQPDAAAAWYNLGLALLQTDLPAADTSFESAMGCADPSISVAAAKERFELSEHLEEAKRAAAAKAAAAERAAAERAREAERKAAAEKQRAEDVAREREKRAAEEAAALARKEEERRAAALAAEADRARRAEGRALRVSLLEDTSPEGKDRLAALDADRKQNRRCSSCGEGLARRQSVCDDCLPPGATATADTVARPRRMAPIAVAALAVAALVVVGLMFSTSRHASNAATSAPSALSPASVSPRTVTSAASASPASPVSAPTIAPASVTAQPAEAPRLTDPPTAPPSDPPDLQGCARSAEATAQAFEWARGAREMGACIERAVAPESLMDLRLRRAKLLFDAYQEPQARTEYEEIVRLFPDDPRPHNRLSWYLLTTSEYRSDAQIREDRRRALTTAEAAASISKRADHKILDTLAEAYMQNGSQQRAQAVLDEIESLTRKPVLAARREQFVSGKTRFMVTHEFSAEYQAGRAWNVDVAALADAAANRLLTVDEVTLLNPAQRSALRNSIFARRGQRLGVHWLDDLFAKMPWYSPRPTFDWKKDLTQADQNNIALIRSVETGKPLESAAAE